MRRAVALLLVAPFLTFASALTLQHVHEPGPWHGHGHAVAHSHFGPHETGVLQSDNVTEVEPDVEHVVWPPFLVVVDPSVNHGSRWKGLLSDHHF